MLLKSWGLRNMALKKTFVFPSGYFGDTFNWCCKIKKSWGQNKFFPKTKKWTATVTPICRSGDEHLFSNYMENLLLFKLSNDENIFFFKFYQRFEFSFHYKRTAMKTLWGLYCLFNKASDTLLIKKLEACGIRGTARWGLHSYLDDKYLYVQTNIVKSNLLTVTCDQRWQVIFNAASDTALQLSQSIPAVSVQFQTNLSR